MPFMTHDPARIDPCPATPSAVMGASRGTGIAESRIGTFTMNDELELRRCRECETVFEPDVADRDSNGEPRCPCFLSSSDQVLEIDPRELVIQQSTPFR